MMAKRHYRHLNLFGSDAPSDGTAIGASLTLVGADHPASINISNDGGGTIIMQMRRTGDWSDVGDALKGSAALVINLLSGFQYRFYLRATGASPVTIQSDTLVEE